MKIYVTGSLRTSTVPVYGKMLRADGFDVFDDWHAAGPRADDEWQRYEMNRGRTWAEAMRGLAANHVFNYDRYHLNAADVGVCVGTFGKSSVAEMVYMRCANARPTFLLIDEDPERWDVMLKFAFKDIFYEYDTLLTALRDIEVTL